MSTVESMRFICSGCGYRARIPSSYTGKVILCPGCQQTQIAAADGGEATGDTVRISKIATAPSTGRFSVPDADGRLRFTCSGCGYSAKLAVTYAGKAISCPQCKSAQVIPPLQGPEGGAGKAQPSPAREPATAPAADDGLTFDDEPAKPAAAAPAAPRKPAAAAVSDDDGLTFGDEPTERATPGGDNDATKPTAVASAKAPVKPSTKPGSGGVVRRGSRSPLPPPEPEVDEDEQDDEPAKASKPLPPWAQKLKEPKMMAIIGGCAAALILQIVLISGWAGASNQAEENRNRAEASETRANTLEKQKADVEFTLSKTSEEVKRLKQTESEAKAALAAAEIRVTDLGEQFKKAEADKADEYARRKKAETAHDEIFTKLQDAEKKRNEEYRTTTELRRKYEEEVKLRKDLKVRLDEAQAASK
ncbi:MAG: hypothetical protein H0W78_16790 [Planctomycetes bacterium]|nr:hypothetical protein [Planctomycetota bacterium]